MKFSVKSLALASVACGLPGLVTTVVLACAHRRRVPSHRTSGVLASRFLGGRCPDQGDKLGHHFRGLHRVGEVKQLRPISARHSTPSILAQRNLGTLREAARAEDHKEEQTWMQRHYPQP